jgi:hypothetical protein
MWKPARCYRGGRGDDAQAIIKSTEVMIAREVPIADRPPKRRQSRR